MEKANVRTGIRAANFNRCRQACVDQDADLIRAAPSTGERSAQHHTRPFLHF
jgi:hypothetical protein